MTFTELAVLQVGVFVGAFVQAIIGMGFAIVVAPILALVDVGLLPATGLLLNTPVALLIGVQARHEVRISDVTLLAIGSLPGAILGAELVQMVPSRMVAPMVAIAVLLAVTGAAFGIHMTVTGPVQLVTGLLSGIMGTLSSVAGPLPALLYRGYPPKRLRGTLAWYFTFGHIISLVSLVVIGSVLERHVRIALLSLPAASMGILAGWLVTPRLDPERIERWVLLVSACAAASVMARSVL